MWIYGKADCLYPLKSGIFLGKFVWFEGQITLKGT